MILFVLILILTYVIWYLRDQKQCEGAPPGPLKFPFLGSIIQVAVKSSIPPLALYKLSRIYGDVMTVRMGIVDFVVCSSYESCREMMSISCKRFMFPVILDRNRDKNLGIMGGYGEPWAKIRRYTIRTLREFGFGKSSSMGLVLAEEVEKFVAFFKTQVNPNGLVYVNELFDVTTVNVLWRLVTGKSHNLDDSKMIELIRLSREYEKNISVTDASVAYPFLRIWFPGWMGKYKQVECVNRLTQFLESLVQEHEQYARNPQCFVDAFLNEINVGSDPEFNREQLVYTLLDLFQGGSETTSKTLTFAMLYMITYPDVQERVFRELENVVPQGNSITLDIKHKLPYTEATLLEILRFSSVVPIPGPLECPSDISFMGLKIKKGAPVMINIHGCHMNETTWGDPLSFRPERFLDDEMKINRNASFIMSFGGGKRICPGQILAESSMFMYFATLMRLFKFQSDGKNAPPIRPTLGVTYSPTAFFMRILERNQ